MPRIQDPSVPQAPPSSSPLLLVAARVLGALFALAGVAKLPMFPSFVRTVDRVLAGGPGMAWTAALVVVSIEVLCGTALLFHKRPRLAAGLLAIQTGTFLWVLYPAVILHRPFVCNCYGILGIQLPNHVEFLVDLLFFDAFGLIALLWPARSKRTTPSTYGSMVTSGIIILFIACAEGVLVNTAFDAVRQSEGQAELTPALVFADVHDPLYASHGSQTRILFLLNFTDFTCPLCFEDFVSLADSLRTLAPAGRSGRVLALMRQSGAEGLSGTDRLRRWADETGIAFPIVLAPDSVFARSSFRKSMVAVVDGSDRILFTAEFPMGPTRRATALHLLSD